MAHEPQNAKTVVARAGTWVFPKHNKDKTTTRILPEEHNREKSKCLNAKADAKRGEGGENNNVTVREVGEHGGRCRSSRWLVGVTSAMAAA